MSFENVSLRRWITDSLRKVGITRMTDIQKQALPVALDGRSLLANSRTGTGKTLIYLLPVLQRLSADPSSVAAVVLLPSRELAQHVVGQLEFFGAGLNLRCALVTGGQSYSRQRAALDACPHVVVATPGKLAELLAGDEQLRRRFANVRLLALDEADQLMDATLAAFVRAIVAATPAERQVIVLSATPDTEGVSPAHVEKTLSVPAAGLHVVTLNTTLQAAAALTHFYLFVPPLLKDYYFLHVLRAEWQKAADDPIGNSIIVFFNKCRQCHFWHKLLNAMGLPSTQVHSFIRQDSRKRNIDEFQNGRRSVLLATDLAARGLDLRSVRLVINYDFPVNKVDYVHRVGRTARGGDRGVALSFVTPRETDALKVVEAQVGVRMREFKTEKDDVVLQGMAKLDKLKRRIKVHFLVKGIDQQFKKIKKTKKEFRKSLTKTESISEIQLS